MQPLISFILSSRTALFPGDVANVNLVFRLIFISISINLWPILINPRHFIAHGKEATLFAQSCVSCVVRSSSVWRVSLSSVIFITASFIWHIKILGQFFFSSTNYLYINNSHIYNYEIVPAEKKGDLLRMTRSDLKQQNYDTMIENTSDTKSRHRDCPTIKKKFAFLNLPFHRRYQNCKIRSLNYRVELSRLHARSTQ